MSTCERCGALVILQRNHHGRHPLLIDPTPDDAGTVVPGIGAFADADAAKRAAGAGRPRYRLHKCDQPEEAGPDATH